MREFQNRLHETYLTYHFLNESLSTVTKQSLTKHDFFFRMFHQCKPTLCLYVFLYSKSIVLINCYLLQTNNLKTLKVKSTIKGKRPAILGHNVLIKITCIFTIYFFNIDVLLYFHYFFDYPYLIKYIFHEILANIHSKAIISYTTILYSLG